jgi:GAF domain-containing protein
VGLAIENSQIFDRSQRALSESESASRQYLRTAWKQMPRDFKITGYRYTHSGAQPIENEEDQSKTELSSDTQAKREITVPIELRGEKIGVLSVQVPRTERLNSDKIDLIKAVAERVAFSAENARLFEETTRRAEREQIISDITAKIGATVRTESILSTAASELSQLLDDADIFIDLQTINKDEKDTE